jgi:hypothetical protein
MAASENALLAGFKRDGYAVIENVLPAATIAELRAGLAPRCGPQGSEVALVPRCSAAGVHISPSAVVANPPARRRRVPVHRRWAEQIALGENSPHWDQGHASSAAHGRSGTRAGTPRVSVSNALGTLGELRDGAVGTLLLLFLLHPALLDFTQVCLATLRCVAFCSAALLFAGEVATHWTAWAGGRPCSGRTFSWMISASADTPERRAAHCTRCPPRTAGRRMAAQASR